MARLTVPIPRDKNGRISLTNLQEQNRTANLSFGDLLRAAISNNTELAGKLNNEFFNLPRNGPATFKTPLYETNAIDTGNIPDRLSVMPIEWLSAGAPLLGLVRVFETPATRGQFPVWGMIPHVVMTGEMSAPLPSQDPMIEGFDYDLTSVAESTTLISTQAVMTASSDMIEAIQAAHRQGLSERIQQQVLAGTGTNYQLPAITGASGIGAATYMATDRGNAEPFQSAEAVIEDADGTPSGWFLGKELSTSARTTLLESGGPDRVEMRRRMTVSGVPSFRTTDLPSTTGIVADWRNAVIVLVLNQIEYTVDRITRPGSVKITSRLPVDYRVIRPSLVYKLEQG